MNRQDILDMSVGTVLDISVAEKVMGFKFEADKVTGRTCWVGYGAYGEAHTPPMAWVKWNYRVPPYSTDISAAWEVMEKFNHVEVEIAKFENIYVVCIDSGYYVRCKTAPEAICKAALLAVMEGDADE